MTSLFANFAQGQATFAFRDIIVSRRGWIHESCVLKNQTLKLKREISSCHFDVTELANIWFANELKGLHAIPLHPGGACTGLGLNVNLTEEEKKAWDTPEIHAYMKSPEQGAATIVYAAVSEEWEGKSGRYLADCVEMKAFREELGSDPGFADDGYAKWAYDPEGEKKLWTESSRLVGMEDD